MRVAIEASDVPVSDEVLSAVDRAVSARVGGASFEGALDLRLRLRRTKSALLCVAAVGFAGGCLVTSTATSTSPFDAIVGALDELPARIERLESRGGACRSPAAKATIDHAAFREQVRRLSA